MNIYEKLRGAAPVGQLKELPLLEMTAIIYFRMIFFFVGRTQIKHNHLF